MNTPAPTSAFKPKIKRVLTRPILKFETDKPRYVLFERALYQGKDMPNPDPSKPKKEPATIGEVVNLETGEVAQILVPAVVKGVFHDDYARNSYVGRCFAITKQSRQPGKQYDPYHVVEIETPEDVAKLATAAAEREAAAQAANQKEEPAKVAAGKK